MAVLPQYSTRMTPQGYILPFECDNVWRWRFLLLNFETGLQHKIHTPLNTTWVTRMLYINIASFCFLTGSRDNFPSMFHRCSPVPNLFLVNDVYSSCDIVSSFCNIFISVSFFCFLWTYGAWMIVSLKQTLCGTMPRYVYIPFRYCPTPRITGYKSFLRVIYCSWMFYSFF